MKTIRNLLQTLFVCNGMILYKECQQDWSWLQPGMVRTRVLVIPCNKHAPISFVSSYYEHETGSHCGERSEESLIARCSDAAGGPQHTYCIRCTTLSRKIRAHLLGQHLRSAVWTDLCSVFQLSGDMNLNLPATLLYTWPRDECSAPLLTSARNLVRPDLT